MNINIADAAVLIFTVSIVSVMIYLVVLLFSSIQLNPTPKEVALLSLITFLFGFAISSYLDGNGVNLLVSALILILASLYFSRDILKDFKAARRGDING